MINCKIFCKSGHRCVMWQHCGLSPPLLWPFVFVSLLSFVNVQWDALLLCFRVIWSSSVNAGSWLDDQRSAWSSARTTFGRTLKHFFCLCRCFFRSLLILHIFVGSFMCPSLPSVLWRCWLGGRKGIPPVETWVVAWLSVWSAVQTCIWPSWCRCHSLSLLQ